MSVDLADQVHALAVADALRRVAPDQASLSDSVSFVASLRGCEPTAPGFDAQVAAAARERVGPPAAERRAAEDAATARRRASGQWTQADVAQASPGEVDAARERGQLAALGVAAPERKPGHLDGVRVPSAALVRRWNSMLPWQAQRERAKWKAQGRADGLSDTAQVREPPVPRDRSHDPRPPTTEEILAQAKRRAELTPDYAGEITTADVQIADPQVVSAWMDSGKLIGLGVPPRRPAR